MPDQATQPLQPASGTTDASTPQPAPAETSLVEQVGAVDTPTSRSVGALPVRRMGPSPLRELRRHARATEDPEPVSITFLTGDYKGQTLKIGKDLGLITTQMSDETGAEWKSREEPNIRSGHSFVSLEEYIFTVKVTMWDHGEDIQHLSENLKVMMMVGSGRGEGDSGSPSPPFLFLRVGSRQAKPVYCSKVSTELTEPFVGTKGFRQADITMTFVLEGGVDTENATGYPLTATPLIDYLQSTTDRERQEQGRQEVVDLLLAPCLGEDGSRQLDELIRDDRLNRPEDVAQLDDNTLVQAVVAGIVPKQVREDPAFRERFRNALASVMASSTNGIGAVDGESPRTFARAILTGDASRVSPNLASQAQRAIQDFPTFFDELLSDRSKNQRIFTTPELQRELTRFGGCGVSLSRVQSDLFQTDNREDQKILEEINSYLQSNPSDEEIRTRFGLESESQVRTLRNGMPYASRDAFVQHSARPGSGMHGHAMWSEFIKTRPTETPNPPTNN